MQAIDLDAVPAIAFSPDGAFLVAATGMRSVGVWRTDNWQQIANTSTVDQLARSFNGVEPLACSADGRFIAVACRESAVFWRPHGGDIRTVKPEMDVEGASIHTIALSPDGELLAVGANWAPCSSGTPRT